MKMDYMLQKENNIKKILYKFNQDIFFKKNYPKSLDRKLFQFIF